MSQDKLKLTDPKEVLSEVDASQVTTLLKRDEGNTFVLDSINAKSEATTGVSSLLDTGDLGGFSSSLSDSIQKQSDSILSSINQMKESGAYQDALDVGEFDFDAIAEQCDIANSESLLDSLGSAFNSLADTGDLLSLDKMREALDFAGFDSLGVIASVAPGVVGATLSAFDLDKLIPNFSEDLLGPYADSFNNALGNFLNDWYWLDKDLGIYDYNLLSRISPWTLNFLELNNDYTVVVRIARGLHEYRSQVSG